MARGKKKGNPAGRKSRRGDSMGPPEDFVQDDKCEACPALCCKYIALEIDEPEDKEDFDNLRWYLIHRDVSVYVVDGDWHLCVDVPCRYLDGNRCTIHETKPLLCRKHDPDECEFQNPDFELDLEFRSWEALKKYMKKNGYGRYLGDK